MSSRSLNPRFLFDDATKPIDLCCFCEPCQSTRHGGTSDASPNMMHTMTPGSNSSAGHCQPTSAAPKTASVNPLSSGQSHAVLGVPIVCKVSIGISPQGTCAFCCADSSGTRIKSWLGVVVPVRGRSMQDEITSGIPTASACRVTLVCPHRQQSEQSSTSAASAGLATLKRKC